MRKRMAKMIGRLRVYFDLFVLSLLFFPGCRTKAQSSQEILSKSDTSEVRFLNSRKFFLYKVNKSETLYSIALKFKIPQEEIRQFNPDLDKTGLKSKMKLWIPAYSWLKKDGMPAEAEKAIEEDHSE